MTFAMYTPRIGVNAMTIKPKRANVSGSSRGIPRDPPAAAAPTAGRRRSAARQPRPAGRARSSTDPIAQDDVEAKEDDAARQDQRDLNVGHASALAGSRSRSTVVRNVSSGNGLGRYPAAPSSFS